MSNPSFNRRDFLKLIGIGASTLGLGIVGPKPIVKTRHGTLVESPGEYGDFLVEKLKAQNFPYEYDKDRIKRMSEKSTTFSRNVWDPNRQNRPGKKENLTYINLVEGEGKVPNQTRLDYALMTAAWHGARSGGGLSYRWRAQSGVRREGMDKLGPWNPSDLDMNWEEVSFAVKHASLFFGASQAGIAILNPLWLYSDSFSPTRKDRARAIPVLSEGERFERTDESLYIPCSMNRVVALAFEENYHGIANSPGRLASAAVGDGYSRMAFTACTLAEFIRALGYRAIPAGNGTGLSIPMAIDAGLGELGRLGLLMTPKYGPRIRLAKVITDMPLVPDSPIKFGVTEFCKACMLCAEHCPGAAITEGPQTWEGKSPSNNPGAFKWYVESEKCYDFNGFSCSNCKRVCPFTKPNNSWLHQMIRKIIETKISPLNKLMVRLDQASGYGHQLQDTEFWKMDGHKTITARESM
ncbi:MAG: reductive dehalogenase [Candidatus Aminicenantes bacterium]|nr:MAG: reductive dehalogenase [Candidatus Aminicenantes bacterium]